MPKNAASRLVYCSSIPESAEKIKRLPVEETCTDHKNKINTLIDISAAFINIIQISEAIRAKELELRCVTVS